MSDTRFRRTAVLWLRGIVLTAAVCALTFPFFRLLTGGAFRIMVRNPADGALPSLLAWLLPSAVICGAAMLSVSTVFCRTLMRIGCIFRGTAAGFLCALLSGGQLLLSRPAAALALCAAASFLRLAVCAAAAVFSDELFSAYGRGDRGAFRSVLRSGTGALLCWSGCAFLASGLCWLFAG